jgi:hypothetical protein
MASKIEVTMDNIIPKRKAHQNPSTLKPSTM